ncbi:TonB-dependent receptor [Natronoflexus pectinivorans]|uniref:Iron complex outermembrane receptor protein n=1 Tax=Natronoflexus pectinivorans TaxID=682526 RepID=A0A4R2GBK0_9BACT|nr:TonB-dependent receptor [Natronoflexus pectinivorans]TCO05405.1 iron complex outermembrane receptor protein [Natronoflexus pectinivorans]
MRKLVKQPLLFILILLFGFLNGNAQTIRGVITDIETSDPLPGANITIAGSREGVISDSDGTFLINIEDWSNTILNITFIGYHSKEIDLASHSSDHILSIQLYPNHHTLSEITISGAISNPVRRNGDALFTGTALTSKGLSIGGAPASASVYHALDILPGVLTEGIDGYGLSDKSVRIRGIRSTFSGMTLEGFPNYGIMPIGARDDIYDMENIESIALYKGASPADLGTATGSKGGAIELRYRRPNEEFGAEVNQSIGSHNFYRSFARVDLGKTAFGTSAFVSFSATEADKWKGPGKMGPRYNAVTGISQQFNEKFEAEVFVNYNSIKRNAYRRLSYSEAINLNENYTKDFSSELTGVASQDFNYYGYNDGTFTNMDFMGIVRYTPDDNTSVSIKGYVSNEEADYDGTVQRGPNFFKTTSMRDISRMGVIPEIQGRMNQISYSAGYWLEIFDNDAQVYNTRIADQGLIPVGYGFFSVNEKKGIIHSPYAKLAYSPGRFKLQAGLKYFHFTDPATERYNSVSATELSELPNESLYTRKMTHHALLPSFGIGYSLKDNMQLYINYGKNYMRPYMYNPIISLYVNNMTTFTDAGMNLQDIFDQWKMETSHHFDFGFRYVSNYLTLSPSIHYARHNNVLASAYDSTVDLDYFQNVGEQTAWGVDTEFYLHPVSWFTLILNPTYTNISYDKNLERQDGIIEIKGNQSPATPRFSLKSGALFSTSNMDISLIYKRIGKRYGDATNIEKIDAYGLFDFSINYSFENISFIRNITAGVDVKNVFDKKHIGIINTSDDSHQGSATYFAGPPRIVSGKISLKF